MNNQDADGREFELRALRLVQAIHDPSGTQGAEMHSGKERDGVFIGDSNIDVYEFTTSQGKQKSIKDGRKIAELIQDLSRKPENLYKAARGFFVTQKEPTAEQRTAIKEIAQREGLQLFALSVDSLRSRLINSEQYVQKRRLAPFGSTDMQEVRGHEIRRSYPYVPQRFIGEEPAETIGLAELVSKLSAGERILVVGDYGGGKSEALRQAFEKLRSLHFKNQVKNKFPLHININDMQGLNTPVEIIRRHAEEVGFAGDMSLISAWRSGLCDLLLDGFDELIPSRWVGGARDLRNVRKSALNSIRRLIAETPKDSGIIVSGRMQYFSGIRELRQVLGLPDATVFRVDEFSDEDVENLIRETDFEIPSWLPRRPLLVKYLHEENRLSQDFFMSEHAESDAWHRLFSQIAQRESERIPSITADNVMRLIARVATLGRDKDKGLGPISLSDMQSAFLDVCNYEPEQEGLQLLQRLPGLRPEPSPFDPTSGNVGSEGEYRRFIDQSLADAAFGFDLADYVANPYNTSHPLTKSGPWNWVTGPISAAVAVLQLRDQSISPGQVMSTVKHRVDLLQFDAILYELCLVADFMEAQLKLLGRPMVREIFIPSLTTGGGAFIDYMQFNECVFESVDISESQPSTSSVPEFRNCLIQELVGLPSIPESLSNNFLGTEIDTFVSSSYTNAGILDLAIPAEDKVALTILRKVYKQKGSARMSSALTRGLPLQLREIVPQIIEDLISKGLLRQVTTRSGGLYGPIAARRNEVLAVMDNPSDLKLLK